MQILNTFTVPCDVFHYYPPFVAAEPKRISPGVKIGLLPEKWKIGNEICD